MDAAQLLESSPHAVLVVRADSRLDYANAAAREALAERGLVPGHPLLELVDPEHRRGAEVLLDAVAAGASGGPVYLRLHDGLGTVAVRGAPTGDGRVQLAVVDVTSAAEDRRRLRLSEQRFRSAFDAGSTGMAMFDVATGFLRVNEALARFFGRPTSWFVGKQIRDVALPEEHELDVEAVRRMRAGESPVRYTRRFRTADGSLRHAVVSSVLLPGEEGGELVLAQVEDVTDRLAAERRLRHAALHDALTDLPGRPLVLQRLEEALAGPGVTAVLFVDLDGFKLVNDALGHAAGDRLLVEAASRLRRAVRSGDTVGRFGGDEFVVVCPGLTEREEGLEVARRVERTISRPFPHDDDEVLVSASVGVAFADEPSGAEALVRDADAAMYRAKELGKRRYEVFDQAMRERAAARATVEQLLRRAVAQDLVVVHYQPVVDVTTRCVVGLEALARVQDGDLLLPESFLDVALDAGLLPAIDAAVLHRAAHDVAGWRAALGADLELAVNVTAGRLDEELPGLVEHALTASGLPRDRLLVELTEQALVSSGPRAGAVLDALTATGVRLGLDDFGTGWASLTYLRRFPVSLVKVDRSFVAGLPDEPEDRTIVEAVVDLARRLGLQCTAEGVESEAQHASVQGMAAPFAQGWLYGPAVPAEQVPAALARLGIQRRL